MYNWVVQYERYHSRQQQGNIVERRWKESNCHKIRPFLIYTNSLWSKKEFHVYAKDQNCFVFFSTLNFWAGSQPLFHCAWCRTGAYSYCPAAASGVLRTRMTESPRRNIFAMKRSLLTGLPFFWPSPVLGISVHISFTYNMNHWWRLAVLIFEFLA